MGVFPGDVAHLKGHPQWGSLVAAGQQVKKGAPSALAAVRVGPVNDYELDKEFTVHNLPRCGIGVRLSIYTP